MMMLAREQHFQSQPHLPPTNPVIHFAVLQLQGTWIIILISHIKQFTMASGKALTPIIPIQLRGSYDTHQVKDTHMHCDCGHYERATVMGIHDDWALWMHCTKPECTNTWYVCNRCPDVRKKITQISALKRHHKNQHKKPTQHERVASMQTGNVSYDSSEAPMTNDDDMILSSDVDELENPIQSEHATTAKKSKIIQPVFASSDVNLDYDQLDSALPEFYNNPTSTRYFQHRNNNIKDGSGGLKFLVKQSLVQTEFQDEELNKMKTPAKHVLLQMQIAKLAFILSKPQHQLVVEILKETWEVGCEDGYRSCQELVNRDYKHSCKKYDLDIDECFLEKKIFRPFCQEYVTRDSNLFPIVIPSTTNDIRKVYTESKFSIVKNLPTPRVMTDVPGHAYVSIIDCIRHFLAHGNSKVAVIPKVSRSENATIISHCSESRKAQEIRRNGMAVYAKKGIKPLCSYLIFWSDDFEPNTSSKQHRGSTWIKTMTIATTKENGHSLKNTFAIAIGKKGKCHDEVERKINNDLVQLQNGTLPPFYIGGAKCDVHIHFELLATLQDQPERRGANHLLLGNATIAARWCASGDHTYLYDKLKCCTTCLQVMRKRYEEAEWNLPLPNCSHCLNWDILKESPLAIYPMPKDYPTIEQKERCRTITIEDKQYLKPFRIEYRGLRDAIEFAHNNLVEGSWTKKNCEAYLKVEGMNDTVAEKVNLHAVMSQCIYPDSQDPPNQLLLSFLRQHPEQFNMMPSPALWERNNTLLSTHVDCIMHMLFLGMVKTVVAHHVPKWLKALHKHASFIDNNGHYLDAFQSMSIDWLVVLTFGKGTMGGWVSENFLGFSRIMLWFYQNLEAAPVRIEDLPPSGVAQKLWTQKHNKHWLKVRGLKTCGKALELKTRVAEFMEKEEVPQPLKLTERKVEHVEATLVAMVNLLQCAMSTAVTQATINKLSYAVRIFLSAFDQLDDNLRDVPDDDDNETATDVPKKVAKKNIAVVSSYNFPCLMNLPQTMSTYGPLRDLWEGGPRGEGFLRFAKPLMSQGVRLNWHTHLMKKLQIMQAFENVMPKQESTVCPLTSDDALKQRSRKFHKYSSQLEARDRLTQCNQKKKTPLSVVILENGQGDNCKVYCVVGDYHTLLCIQFDPTCGTRKKFGLIYHKCHAANATINWTDDIVPCLRKDAKIGYGVLLPLLTNNDDSEYSRHFALVSSNWRALEDSNSLVDLIDKHN